MKHTVHIGKTPIILEHGDFGETINVDSLTLIDHSNIFGEIVTASASANRIGMMKAEIEDSLSQLKLDLRIYEAEYRGKKRKEANDNAGSFNIRVGKDLVSVKITEKALETCFETEPEWIELKKKMIDAERKVNLITSLYWSTQQKCRNLTNAGANVTPEEFVNELVEGVVNGILIKKAK